MSPTWAIFLAGDDREEQPWRFAFDVFTDTRVFIVNSFSLHFFFLEYIFWTSMLNIDVIERIDRYLG